MGDDTEKDSDKKKSEHIYIIISWRPVEQNDITTMKCKLYLCYFISKPLVIVSIESLLNQF